MTELLFKAKNDRQAAPGSRLFFCAHPDDYAAYLDSTCLDVLASENCSVWYKKDPASPVSTALLSQFTAFVIPVTYRFLTEPGHAKDSELAYAITHRIPILPILREAGLETEYATVFGQRQFLIHPSLTAAPMAYKAHLSAFLRENIAPRTRLARIQSAFRARVFLSYRKKDREAAKELIDQIHSHKELQDVAVWYDDLLTLGEDFNNSIRAALKSSDLFLMSVTPNIANEESYVSTEEYPLAMQEKKPVLPVMMRETDLLSLKERFPGIGDCAEKETLSEAFARHLGARNDVPTLRQIRHLATAYLYGVNTEINTALAVSLLEHCASHGDFAAMGDLVQIYVRRMPSGQSFKRAIHYQKRIVAEKKRRFLSTRHRYAHFEWNRELFTLARILDNAGRGQRAIKCYLSIIKNSEDIPFPYNKYAYEPYVRVLAHAKDPIALGKRAVQAIRCRPLWLLVQLTYGYLTASDADGDTYVAYREKILSLLSKSDPTEQADGFSLADTYNAYGALYHLAGLYGDADTAETCLTACRSITDQPNAPFAPPTDFNTEAQRLCEKGYASQKSGAVLPTVALNGLSHALRKRAKLRALCRKKGWLAFSTEEATPAQACAYGQWLDCLNTFHDFGCDFLCSRDPEDQMSEWLFHTEIPCQGHEDRLLLCEAYYRVSEATMVPTPLAERILSLCGELKNDPEPLTLSQAMLLSALLTNLGDRMRNEWSSALEMKSTPERALPFYTLAEELLNRSEETEKQDFLAYEQARICERIGQCYLMAENKPQASSLYAKALSVYYPFAVDAVYDTNERIAEIYSVLSEHRTNTDLKTAQDMILRTVAFLKSQPDSLKKDLLLAKNSLLLAETYTDDGAAYLADHYYKESISRFEEIQKTIPLRYLPDHASAMLSYCRTLTAVNPENGREYLKNVLTLLSAAYAEVPSRANRFLLAKGHWLDGAIAKQSGEWERALTSLRRASAILTDIPQKERSAEDIRLITKIHVYSAAIHFKQKRVGAGLRSFCQAYRHMLFGEYRALIRRFAVDWLDPVNRF